MNLRELLLQFAGENARSLQLEELISSKLPDAIVAENTGHTITVIPNGELKTATCMNKAVQILEQNGYEDYEVEETDGTIAITI